MAVYRNVSMGFWTDTKIADDFTSSEKYFMLYCLTNPYTNLCGCYEISLKQMSIDLGYDIKTVENLLNKFNKQYGIVEYNFNTKELLIKNWHKYNWSKSDKLDKPLLTEINNVKTPEFHNYLANLYNKRDTVSIRYRYGIDRLSIHYGYNCICFCY